MAHPLHPVDHPDLLDRTREICLALPETTEKIAWGAPTFRVKGKLFVHYRENHHGDGRVALWCNAAPGAQDALVGADPDRFFVPPYVGKGGWIGVRIDGDADWEEIGALVEEAWRVTAPPKLVEQHDAGE